MAVLGGYRAVLQLAKNAVDALALGQLYQFLQSADASLATIDDAGRQIRLRFARPALTFPEDVPEMVRLGLAIEGGVELPDHRILSVDAFVTATATPYISKELRVDGNSPPSEATASLLPNDPESYCAVVDFANLDFGDILIHYAGHPVVDGVIDHVGETDLAEIRVKIQQMTAEAIDHLPRLPLTYRWGSPSLRHVDLHVRPEAKRGGALMLGLERQFQSDEASTIPVSVSSSQNAAILLHGDVFRAMRSSLPLPTLSPLTPDWHITRGEIHLDTRSLRFDLTVTSTQADSPEDTPLPEYTLRVNARPLILSEIWDLLVDEVAFVEELSDDHPLRLVLDLPRQDETLRLELAAWAQAITMRVVTTELGAEPDHGVWFWQHPLPEQRPTPFMPSLVYVARGALVVAGTLPVDLIVTHTPDDAPTFQVQLSEPLREEENKIIAQVTAGEFQRMTAPYDVHWSSSLHDVEPPSGRDVSATFYLTQPPLVEEIAEEDDERPDEDQTPKRTKSRPLPAGYVMVIAHVIDGYGRSTRADLEIDLTTFRNISTLAADMGSDRPTRGIAQRTTRILSRRGLRFLWGETRHRLDVAQRELREQPPIWTMLTYVFILVALIATLATVLLDASPKSIARGMTTPLPATQIPGNVIIVATDTPLPTPIPTLAPTSTPLPPTPYGRFAITPTVLLIGCGDTTAQPLILKVTNSGSAMLNWHTQAIEVVNGAPWASIFPNAGQVAPGKTVAVQVVPQNGFCLGHLARYYHIQFIAPNAIPITVAFTP